MMNRLILRYKLLLKTNRLVLAASYVGLLVLGSMIIVFLTAPPEAPLRPEVMQLPNDKLSRSEVWAFNDRRTYNRSRVEIENDLKDIGDLLIEWRKNYEQDWPEIESLFSESMTADDGFIITAVLFETLAYYGGDSQVFIRPPYPLLSADKKAKIQAPPERTLPPPRPLAEILADGHRAEWALDYGIDWSFPPESLRSRPYIAARRPLNNEIIALTIGGDILRVPLGERIDENGFITLDDSVSRLDVGVVIPHAARITSAGGAVAFDIFQHTSQDVTRESVNVHGLGTGDTLRAWIR